jgi:uncharacterized protein (TIGR02118 family)
MENPLIRRRRKHSLDLGIGTLVSVVRGRSNPRGLVRTEVDRGIAGFPPGAPPPYHAVGHLFFHTMADMERALTAMAAEFIADERNYTDGPSVVQISEVVDSDRLT